MVDSATIAAWVRDARERSLELIADLTDRQLKVERLYIVNPLDWEIGHVAYFQELFVLRALDKAKPFFENADAIFDSINIEHDVRWDLPIPPRERVLEYLKATRDRTVARLGVGAQHAAPLPESKMQATLERILNRETLDQREAEALMATMLRDDAPDALIAATLAALRTRGETAPELAGFTQALLNAAQPCKAAQPCIDTCGTGGDGAGTFNISTATALLCAAQGLNIVKHGNRSVTSKSGSADVIEALRIPFHATDAKSDARFRFLFAPHYHTALKRLAPLRKQLGVRTVFNLIGPLANPARPQLQLVGVAARERVEPTAHALRLLGTRHAFVVWGEPGLDEATPVAPFVIFEVQGECVSEREMKADDFGLPRCRLEDLRGGDARENAAIIEAVFKGEKSPRRDVIVLNAALVFLLAGVALYPKEAAALAQRVLESGAALKTLEALRG